LIHYSSRSDWGALELLPTRTRSALHVVAGTIEDSHFLTRVTAGHAIVFHLAALIAIPHSYAAPLSYVRTNVEGTLNVIEAARAAGAERVVHTSTSEAYGTAVYSRSTSNTPSTGNHPTRLPRSGPTRSPRVMAQLRRSGHHAAAVQCLRHPAVGASDHPDDHQSSIDAKGHPARLPDTRAGSELREDTARAFMKIAESEKAIGRTINAGAGKGITIGELARLVLSVMEYRTCRSSTTPLGSAPSAARCSTSSADNRLAADLIDWRPTYSLREGLRETIRFVEANLELFKAWRVHR
jgi:nucleoside-diphosphate-sugar epimerase